MNEQSGRIVSGDNAIIQHLKENLIFSLKSFTMFRGHSYTLAIHLMGLPFITQLAKGRMGGGG